jgi:glycosyltransferase involved in cell wall biosynthesis
LLGVVLDIGNDYFTASNSLTWEITRNNNYTISQLLRIPKYVIVQLKLMYHLIKMKARFDIAIFYVGGGGLILPMLTAKLLRKKIVLIMPGSVVRSAAEVYKGALWGFGGFVFPRLLAVLEGLSCRLSNQIVVYSPSLITFGNLGKYKGKIIIAHEHFLDFNLFRVEKALAERDKLIGYIGRLSEEKGTMNFIKAIPEVLKVKENFKFLIIGQGPLYSKIKGFLNEHNLNDRVSLLDWIPHDEMPKYLNRLKLLVLPSYTEGLPNIILEAMACGTPVLATLVGSIPDLIRDGETGFILENNKPETIAHGIIRALNNPKMDDIALNAHKFAEQNYTYGAAVEGYKNILESLRLR